MAINFYLKLDGAPGECQDKGFENTIKLHSWSWGASNTATIDGTSGASGGTVSLSDLTIMKDLDMASPKLLKCITTGKSIATATLSAVKSTGADQPELFMKIDLAEVYVTSVQLSASSEVPMESVSLAFANTKTAYHKQGPDGTMVLSGSHGFDLRTKVTS